MTVSFASIFSECQRSIATHKRCIKEATALLKGDKKTIQEFVVCIDKVLVVDKRHPAVERCVSFIGHFIASYSSDATSKPLWAPILSHLLERSNVKDASVRFRVCQIVAEILSLMPEDIEIDDEIWDQLSAKMIVRTKDKAAITRAHAVRALARLQDPSSSDDPVIAEYVRLLATDPSQEVRKVVLAQIGISKKTLPHIIQRSRDTCDDIRKDTYQLIGKKVDIRALTIAQRLYVLEEGLQDRSVEVRKAAVAMTAGWQNLDHKESNSCCGILLLLRCLDIENEGESVGVLVVKELHKAGLLQLPKLNLISLTAETALLWRVMCEVWKEQKDPMLESLPEVSQLCRIILQQNESTTNDFVVRQLILLSKFVDLADEVGRRSLNALVCQMLSDLKTPLDFINPLLEVLHSFHNPKDFASFTLEIISELRYPLYERKLTGQHKKGEEIGQNESDNEDNTVAEEELLNNTQGRLRELQKRLALVTTKQSHKKRVADSKRKDGEEETCLHQEIAQLEQVLELLSEKITKRDEAESKIWCQSLDITLFLLQNTKHMKEHAGIAEIHSVMLIKALSHPLPVVRARGVCCAVLYCLLDQAAAFSHIPIFLELLSSDLPPIQLTVLKGLFDLGAYFGAPLLQDSFSFRNETRSLLSFIAPSLFHDDDDFRSVSVEGFAKLYMSDIVTTPQYFTSLVLYFFNPTTVDDLELRQCLSVFFPAFAVCNVSAHSALIEAAFVPTLKTIIHAPSSSPIKKIPILQVSQFLLSLLDTAFIRTSENSSGTCNHATIALDLAHEILANATLNKELCKVFNHINITDEDQDHIKAVTFLVEEMLAETALKRDKLIQKSLAKFAASLTHLDKTPATTLAPTKRELLRGRTKDLAASYGDDKCSGKAQKVRQRKPSVKKARAYISDSDSSDISESESSEEELIVKAPARAPSTRRANIAAKSKLQAIDSTESEQESEDSSEESEDSEQEDGSEEDIANASEDKKRSNAPHPAKQTATKKMTLESSSSEYSDNSSYSSNDSGNDCGRGSPELRATAVAAIDVKPSTQNATPPVESLGPKTSRHESSIEGADAEAELAMFDSVRQVRLYDSSDDDCEVSLAASDEETEDPQADKENIPLNIQPSLETPHTKPKTGLNGLDTTKRQRCQELRQEIGDLLDDDPVQSFVQRTATEVSRLLLDDSEAVCPPEKTQQPTLITKVSQTKIPSKTSKLVKTSPPSKPQASNPHTKPPAKPSPPSAKIASKSAEVPIKAVKSVITRTPALDALQAKPTLTALKSAKSPPVSGRPSILNTKARPSLSSVKTTSSKPLQRVASNK